MEGSEEAANVEDLENLDNSPFQISKSKPMSVINKTEPY